MLDLEQMNFLLTTIGLGGAPVQRFDVQYIVAQPGGGFSFSRVDASNLTEVIKSTTERIPYTGKLAVMQIAPTEVGANRQLELMNYKGID